MMRTILAFCLISAACLMAAAPARAVVLPDFYKADVPVASQSVADRSAAFQQAMAQILVKITGSTVIMQMPKAEELAQQAAKYVRQFRYAEQPGQAQTRPAKPGEDYKPFIISVTFNGEALERALLEAGLPIWNADRQPVLVIAGVQERDQRVILSAQMEHPVKQALEQAAALRGVPLLFPLMDQKERKQVDFADIRGGFSESLLQLARRYSVSLVLEAYIEADSSGDWSSRWAVHRDTVSSRWNESYVALAEAVQSGIGGAADILASRYAIATAGDNTLLDVQIKVNRLSGLNDYAAVLNYLDGLIFIENAMPVQVEPDSVVFRILMRSELAELERILTVSRILRPVAVTGETVAATPHDRIDLTYSYQKR